jgi:outer membrane protein assembly factor BamB
VRLSVLLASAIALTSVSGCGLFGGGEDNIEPPAELVEFEPALDVRRVWNASVGGDSERLRLGLRPTTDGARIFAASHGGRLAAFDAQTGRRQWQIDTDLPLSAGPSFGAGVLVIGTNDGELAAFSAEDGSERWRVAVGSEVLAPPAVANNVAVFRSVDGRLRAVSLANGEEVWSVAQNMPALTVRGNTAPYLAGQVVVCGFDNGRVGAYQLSNGDPVWELAIASPTGRNELERLVDVSAGIQVVGNDVYTASYQGRAVGIDLRTGLVIWQQDMSSFAGVGADINSVYLTNDFDSVIAMDRQGGVEIWRQDALRLRDVTAATRFRDAVVVGDFDGYLHWLSPDDGRFLARERAASGRITWAPLVVGLNVYVQGDDGSVAAYALVEESD